MIFFLFCQSETTFYFKESFCDGFMYAPYFIKKYITISNTLTFLIMMNNKEYNEDTLNQYFLSYYS